MNQILNQLEERISEAPTPVVEEVLHDLDVLSDYQDSVLENWLFFDERLQAIRSTALQLANAEQESKPVAWIMPVYPFAVADSAPVDGHRDWREQSRKGLGFFDLQMFREAKKEFAQVLDREPNLEMIRLFYTLSMMAGGEGERAEQELARLLDEATDEAVLAAAWAARAQRYAEAGLYKRAEEALFRVLALRASDLDAHLNLAICAYVDGDYKKSARYATHAARIDANEALAWRLVGAARFADGDGEGGLAAYRQALVIAPKQAGMMIETAQVLQALARMEEAEALYQELLHERERVADAYLGLAEINLKRRRYRHAAVLLKKRLTLLRDDPHALLWLSYAEYGEGDGELAQARFARLLDQPAPISLLARTGLARIATDRREFDLAKRWLQPLLTHPEAKWCAYGLTEYGYLCAKRGKQTPALRVLERALQLVPGLEDAQALLLRLVDSRANVLNT